MTTIEQGDELARILRLRIEAGREDDMVTIALSVADAELLLAQHNGATQGDKVLREALEPFAEVAAWAERNGHDLNEYDMLLRGPDKQIAGHLQAQADDFIRARAALSTSSPSGGMAG